MKNRALSAVWTAHLLRQVVLVVDRLDRADRLARAAVDALVGVDVQRAAALVDAVDRAFLDTGTVFDVHAGQRDHVGHRPPPPGVVQRTS